MAHIEYWYRCPVCKAGYSDEKRAVRCKNRHQIIAERYAVPEIPGSADCVRIFDAHAPASVCGEEAALETVREQEKKIIRPCGQNH